MGERRLDGAFDEEVGVFCCFADLDILTYSDQLQGTISPSL